MPCAASPPSAFCHEKVATSILGQGMSIANTALVASHSVRPSRWSLIQSPLGTITPLVVPFQAKTMSWAGLAWLRSGSWP